MVRALAVLVALLAAGAAHGDADDSAARARAHFEVGRLLYRDGDYTGALREFDAGYHLAPRPGFLVNMARARRRLHQLDEALRLYRGYLEQAAAGDPERERVAAEIAEVEHEAAPASRAPPPAAAPHLQDVKDPFGPLDQAAVERPAQAPPRSRRWLAPLLGSLGAVVVVAVTVGLVLGLSVDYADRERSGCNQAAGCVLVDGLH